MRFAVSVLAAALFAAPAVADEIDAATMDAVRALATQQYENPSAAVVERVRKSKDPSGRGYCGAVTIEEIPDSTTNFHVRLAGEGFPAELIRLYDLGPPERGYLARQAHEAMRAYGCIE